MTDTQLPAAGDTRDDKKKPPAWIWIVAAALFIGGVAAVFALLNSGGDDNTEAGGLSPDLVLQLQTLCFENNPPLFYDDQGYCYSVDPSTLGESELVAQRVLPQQSGTDSPAAPAAPAATSGPAAPAPPAPAPAAPAATSGPAAPAPPAPAPAAPAATNPPAAPAAPTTTAPTTAAPTTAAPTTAAPTTAPPVNINVTGGWKWNLSFPASIDGVPCVKDAADKYPPGCQDAYSGNYSLSMTVTDGAVSGSQTIPQMGSKTATLSGSISPSGSAPINVSVGNLGNWSLNGTFSGSSCSVSGNYFHDLSKTAGTFTLTSNNASTC